MSTLRSARLVAIMLLMTLLWPTLGLAQSAPPAGVVTGLQGRATVARPVVPQPIPLKFKDDLFLRDQVATQENSLVRVLLGGKALVTVRELSTFAITEEPGRAAVDLKSGKIAVGVAKSLLKAGEAIEIHTPNAIAAVRGSLLVVAVQNVGGVLQSFFTALDASLPITVTPLGGAGAAVALGPNQAVGVSGSGASINMGPVQNVSPATARREAQTASVPRTAEAESLASPMAPTISAAKFQEATQLASLLAPPPTTGAPSTTATPPSGQPAPPDPTLTSASQPQLLQASGSTLTVASQAVVSSVPPPPSTSSLGVNAAATAQAATGAGSGTGGLGGPVVIAGQNLVLAANQTLKTYTGQSSSTDPGAAVTVTNSTVTGPDNLIVVEPGANASLAGGLLAASGTTATPTVLAANSSVVDIRGALSSSTAGAFIRADPTVMTTTDVLRITGGSLTLTGPLLTDTQGTYAASRDFLSVQQGGTLASSAVAPLLQFSRSAVGIGAPGSQSPSHLLTLGGTGSSVSLGGSLAGLTNNSVMTLNGGPGSALIGLAPGTSMVSPSTLAVVTLTGSTLTLGPGVRVLLGTGGTLTGGSLLRGTAGSSLVADLAVPVVDLTNTSVNLSGALVRLEGGSHLSSGGVKVTGGSLTADTLLSTDRAGNTADVHGTVLDLSNSTATLRALSAHDQAAVNTDTVVSVLSLNQPTLRLSSSTLSLTKVDEIVVGLGENTGSAPTIPGVGLTSVGTSAAPSTINLKGTLLGLTTATVTATQPLLQLDHTTVNQTGTTSALIAVLLPPGQAATAAGPFLSATNSTINTSGRLFYFNGGTLTSNSTSALLFFDPTTVTSAAQLIQVDNGSNLTLNGALLTAQATTFGIGNQNLNAFGLATVLDGSKITSTTTTPLLVFDASSVRAGAVLSIRRSASTLARSTLTLSGPLFSAINGSTFNTSSLGLGPTLGTTGGQCCSVVSVTQGSQLSSTGTAPLLQMVGSTVRTGPDAQSGGSIFNVSDTFTGAPAAELVAPSTVTLAGPLLVANGSSLSALSNVLSVTRSSFQSATTDPLIQLNGSTVTLGGVDPFTGANANSRLAVVSASTTTPASLSLRGPLVSATNSTITTGQEILGVFGGASLTDTSAAALLSLTGGSATAGTAVIPGSGGNFISFASSPTIPFGSSVSLAGPLLNAVNTTLRNGDPTSNTYAFMFIGDSARLTSTSAAPLLSLNSASVVTSGGFVTVRRSLSAANPTTLTLAGPLFAATNGSTVTTTSLGSSPAAACCSTFFIGQAAKLISTGTGSLIQLTGSTFNAGPDVRSGGNLISIFDTGACCGDTNLLVAPSQVMLSGSLISATNSNISALFNLLSVARSGLSSASVDPLIQLSGSTVSLGGVNPFGNVPTTGRLVVLVSSSTAGAVASPASIALTGAGPLLTATNSTVTTSSDLIGIFNGGTFTSAATVPLVRLTGGSVTTQITSGFPGFLLNLGGAGGPTGTGFATAQFGGALLNTTGALNLAGGLLQVFSGGQVTTTGSTSPFVFLDGGSHTIAGTTTNSPSMFSLSGRNTATAVDPESGLSLGTDRPIQGALQLDGTRPILTALLETSGAKVTGQKVLRMDDGLLEATAPLFNLTAKGTAQSVVTTTGTNAIDLTFAARVSALGSSLVRLDNSILNVNSGSLVNVNTSKLSVSGDLVNLLNGATLTVLNGPLITVSGSGFVSIAGGLINFGGTGGNRVNITNSLCPCTLFGGVPVALQNGALATNVQIATPIRNPTLGTLNLSPNAALAAVNGPGSKLRVGGQ